MNQTSMRGPSPEASGPPTDWRLPREKINELQQASLVRMVAMCKHAHFVNVKVRIDGQWREFEADWIKHLAPDHGGDTAEHAP